VCLHACIPSLYTVLAIVMSSPPMSASNLAKSCQISGCSLKQLKHCVNECLTRSFSPASFTLSGFDISYSVIVCVCIGMVCMYMCYCQFSVRAPKIIARTYVSCTCICIIVVMYVH
jgi:hypothetical protein